jgi:hypothetical protein
MYLSVLYLFLFVFIFSLFSFLSRPPMLGGERGRPPTLANYSATVLAPTDPDAPDKAKSLQKFGTLAVVYFPCMQHLFGVIRLTWIIGTAGIVQGFCLVAMCCALSDPRWPKIAITTRPSPLSNVKSMLCIDFTSFAPMGSVIFFCVCVLLCLACFF